MLNGMVCLLHGGRPDRMVYCMFAVADAILVVCACKKKRKRERKGLEWTGN